MGRVVSRQSPWALVDLNKLEPLADALDALAQVGVGKLNTAGLALGKARGKARQFGANPLQCTP
jgi:hypothetical protein